MHRDAIQLALQRHRYPEMTDEAFRFMVQQVDGRARTREKLPSFAQEDDWWYPVRLSCEQCSSEATARYKVSLLPASEYRLIDLTGGYGVDTYFMSEQACEGHYVEQDAELCRIVAHNFASRRARVAIHNTSAEAFLECFLKRETAGGEKTTVVYIDPARRDQHGGKVYRIEDCEPNVLRLLPTLREVADKLIIKLSPMLDISAALRSLSMAMDVHIVALDNEVKEVLLVSDGGVQNKGGSRIFACNLPDCFRFSKAEEEEAQCEYYGGLPDDLLCEGNYIYEPNASILKAGAYKLVAARYNVQKLGKNTHLYISQSLVSDFPGRRWRILGKMTKEMKGMHASVLTRNYPMSTEDLRKKWKVKESDTHTIIGARLGDRPLLMLAEKC